MKSVIFASLLASAAAFAPASQTVAPTTALSAFKDELGAQVPLGFFDPAGLVKDGDQATFDRLRFVEIKHGRIAMIAVLGQVRWSRASPQCPNPNHASPLLLVAASPADDPAIHYSSRPAPGKSRQTSNPDFPSWKRSLTPF